MRRYFAIRSIRISHNNWIELNASGESRHTGYNSGSVTYVQWKSTQCSRWFIVLLFPFYPIRMSAGNEYFLFDATITQFNSKINWNLGIPAIQTPPLDKLHSNAFGRTKPAQWPIFTFCYYFNSKWFDYPMYCLDYQKHLFKMFFPHRKSYDSQSIPFAKALFNDFHISR